MFFVRHRFIVAALAAALTVAACSKGPAWKKNTFASRAMKTEIEAEMPTSLLSELEAMVNKAGASGGGGGHEQKPEAKSEGKAEGSEHGGGGEPASISALPSQFSPLKVYLIEKNRGLLGREHFELTYGPGGGELDLRDFVQPRNGSFYFAVEFMPALEKAERRVFFLSNSRIRQLGKETYGSGCNTYFDVSKAFAANMGKDGFLVNTSDGRHVSALAGIYFFAAVADGKLHLAHLTVRDSGQKALQCRH
jgi:hypothetical protein